MELLAALLTWTQLATVAGLVVFAFHRGLLVVLALRHGKGALSLDPAALPAPAAGPELPRVTVQLPIYNERHVADRLVRAAAAIDWPRDRLQIQVLDDSTDDTTDILSKTLEQLPADLDAVLVRRDGRAGFKAGALAHGMVVAGPERATGAFFAIFDADFMPPVDFLRRTIPPFDDPAVGMVQSRWEHLNADHSLLTRIQAILLDGHFAVEHVARAGQGHLFNFNGTGGVFRRSCIDDAGGWQPDTLTEDMDLSYRAQLAGWKFRYLPALACPAELPTNTSAFLNQQYRWAKGSIQVGSKHLRALLRAQLPLATKVEAAFHLWGNIAFPMLLLLILVSLPLQVMRLLGTPVPDLIGWFEATPLLFGTSCVLVYYGVAQARLGRFGWRRLLQLPLLLSTGAALAVNNTLAVGSALFGERGEFRRTPKSGGEEAGSYRSTRGVLPIVESALGLWCMATFVASLSMGHWVSAVFNGLFAAGLLWVGAAGFGEGREQRNVGQGRQQHGIERGGERALVG